MSIVGVWEVHAEGAPFGYHVMTFHADGTMLQSNPDLGNRDTSDSNGMGSWRAEGAQVAGAFLEFTVDRQDLDSARKGIVHFELTVNDDEFTGSASAIFYDLNGTPRRGPLVTRISGKRFDFQHLPSV
ncbi:hypothetical protein IRT45_30850 [Nocardia sp. BSTN01]|uniref:hypothetical protein n=1 Tax=Nocardia sp. BSTN01 TaxID=2783665 RepID=UPI00188ECF8A|nr:hypothetical protein [Nocardia sp. BSTN01]MBF5001533.1 hypothetical protein [Nocardia sp. BSTN01]